MQLMGLDQRHGTLAWPLGWAAAELLVLAGERPQLALEVLTAPRPRLHLLAFVLALSPTKPTAGMLEDALRRPMRDVVRDLGFAELRGLRRLLGRIPGSTLQRADYRLLADLLADPSAAHVLYHASEMSTELLANLRTLPSELRSPVIVDAIAHIPCAASHILVWTEIVALRSPLLSADKIRQRLGNCGTHAELRLQLEKLLDNLPALEAPPPQNIGHAVRVDTPSAIRQLGKRFRNCLAGFVDAEVDGTTHLYHWQSPDVEAVCEVARAGNLGWFLGNHLGPENDPLPSQAEEQIRMAFAAVAIHPLAVVETYDDLYFGTGRRSPPANGSTRTDRRQRGRYCAD
jgi:hypothetical protein